jgi:hypothetical protein
VADGGGRSGSAARCRRHKLRADGPGRLGGEKAAASHSDEAGAMGKQETVMVSPARMNVG